MQDELDQDCTIMEYILNAYGYCPKPEYLRLDERNYHAIFLPTFHTCCFLYLSISSTDPILTFGFLHPHWEYSHSRADEIISAIEEKHDLSVLSDDTVAFLKRLQMEALREKYHFPPESEGAATYLQNARLAAFKEGYGSPSFLNDLFLSVSDTQIQALSKKYEIQPFPDEISLYLTDPNMVSMRDAAGFPSLRNEEAIYVRDVQMVGVSLEALQRFEQQMQDLHPFEVETVKFDFENYRDGMCARGIITDTTRSHRFDIRCVPQTDQQRAFFQAFIDLGDACFGAEVQELLKNIQRYLSGAFGLYLAW